MRMTCIAHVRAEPDFIAFMRDGFRSSDMYMARTSHGDALVFVEHRDEMTTTDAWNAAETIIRNVVGALHAFANLIGPISIVAPVSVVDDTGKEQITHLRFGGTLRVYLKEGRAGLLHKTVDGLDTVVSRIVRMGHVYPEVTRALALLHDHGPSWSDIYLLMEIIELNLRTREHHHAGKDWVAITAQRWLPASVVRAVKRNAGYHRHAKQFSSPKPLLALADAQNHCKFVVAKWLESLSAA